MFAVQQISALFNVSLNITSIDYRSTRGCLSDVCDQTNSLFTDTVAANTAIVVHK